MMESVGVTFHVAKGFSITNSWIVVKSWFHFQKGPLVDRSFHAFRDTLDVGLTSHKCVVLCARDALTRVLSGVVS